mgnify:CR=1 FL=1
MHWAIFRYEISLDLVPRSPVYNLVAFVYKNDVQRLRHKAQDSYVNTIILLQAQIRVDVGPLSWINCKYQCTTSWRIVLGRPQRDRQGVQLVGQHVGPLPKFLITFHRFGNGYVFNCKGVFGRHKV